MGDEIPDFRQEISLEKRTKEYELLRSKYPHRIPIILTQHPSSKLPMIQKRKYLVPETLTIGGFMYNVRTRIKLKPEIGVFLFAKNNIMPNTEEIGSIHQKYKSEDGFLYLLLTGENTFGSAHQ